MAQIPCSVMRDMIDLFLEGEVSPETRRLLEEHVDECASCRALVASRRRVLEALRQLKEPPAGAGSPPPPDDARVVASARRRLLVSILAVGVAVMLLLALLTHLLLDALPGRVDLSPDEFARLLKHVWVHSEERTLDGERILVMVARNDTNRVILEWTGTVWIEAEEGTLLAEADYSLTDLRPGETRDVFVLPLGDRDLADVSCSGTYHELEFGRVVEGARMEEEVHPVSVSLGGEPAEPGVVGEIWLAASTGAGAFGRFFEPWFAVDTSTGHVVFRLDARAEYAPVVLAHPGGWLENLGLETGYLKALSISESGVALAASIDTFEHRELSLVWLDKSREVIWQQDYAVSPRGALQTPVHLSLAPDGQALLVNIVRPGSRDRTYVPTVSLVSPGEGLVAEFQADVQASWAVDWERGRVLLAWPSGVGTELVLLSTADLSVVASGSLEGRLQEPPYPYGMGGGPSAWWLATKGRLYRVTLDKAGGSRLCASPALEGRDLDAMISARGWCACLTEDGATLLRPDGEAAWSRAGAFLAAASRDGSLTVSVRTVSGDGREDPEAVVEVADASGDLVWTWEKKLQPVVSPVIAFPTDDSAMVYWGTGEVLVLDVTGGTVHGAAEVGLHLPEDPYYEPICCGAALMGQGRYLLVDMYSQARAALFDLVEAVSAARP